MSDALLRARPSARVAALLEAQASADSQAPTPTPLSTNTPNYGWQLPDVGGSTNVWGAELNATLTSIDATCVTMLPLAGGTLTGPVTLTGSATLTLAADPTTALEAATKQYADHLVVGTYLPLSGGTLTGPLTLAGAPVNPLDAATKGYIDTTAGAYLPLAGGMLTGGIAFGSTVAPGGASDLSRHIALYANNYGFNVTSATINMVVGGSPAWSVGYSGGIGTLTALAQSLTMTSGGPLGFYLSMNKAATTSNNWCGFYVRNNATGTPLNRWQIMFCNTTAETGANAGSDFGISRYDDNGVILSGVPFTITRSTGTVTLMGGTTFSSSPIAMTVPAGGVINMGGSLGTSAINLTGTGAANENLTISTETGAGLIKNYRQSTDATANATYFYKSRGTAAAPAQLATGDNLGDQYYWGYDGSIYRAAALIRATCFDPNVASANPSTAMGTGISFWGFGQGGLGLTNYAVVNRPDFITNMSTVPPSGAASNSFCAINNVAAMSALVASPGAPLQYAALIATSAGTSCGLWMRQNGPSAGGCITWAYTARGTSAAPTVSNTNDIALDDRGYAYNGTAFTQITSMRHTLIEPTPSSTAMGSQLQFFVVQMGGTSLRNVFALDTTAGMRFGIATINLDPAFGSMGLNVPAIIQLRKQGSGGNYANYIQGHTGTGTGITTTLRWQQALGDLTSESGSNAGSNYALAAYSDTGVLLGNVMTAVRSTQIVTFAQTIVNGSDARWKENVTDIPGALAIVSALQGVRYTIKGSDRPAQIGLIAQDVQKVLPEVVMETGDQTVAGETYPNALGIAYSQTVAVLIEAIKELKVRVEQLEARAA